MILDLDEIAVTGKCDSCGSRNATRWFGNTSGATCDDQQCIKQMNDRYIAHCEEIEEQCRMDEEMGY